MYLELRKCEVTTKNLAKTEAVYRRAKMAMRQTAPLLLMHREKGDDMVFDGKTILVTGGTGSFGQEFVKYLITNYRPKKIIIFSRDEMKQWEMEKKFSGNPHLRFFIGDVRDRARLNRAFQGVDYIVHAAATKIVPTSERDPFECIKTNVIGAMNVIDAAIDNGVDRVVALSTDKASSPVNLYGASKLASDKLFVASNVYGVSATSFSVVRYGNVMGSRGSVIPLFIEAAKSGELPITDLNMTRFMITMSEGIQLVEQAFEDMKGGEIYVKKLPSIKIVDLAKAVSSTAKFIEIGIRPGEKIHEEMISPEDAITTVEYDDYFKIFPSTFSSDQLEACIGQGEKVKPGFRYTSDANSDLLSIREIRAFIDCNKDKFLSI